MICPQTKAECAHESCCGHQCFKQVKEIILAAPPKPTMAEFERLVLALRQSSYDLGEFVENNASAQLISETRKIDEQNYAALIDFARRMGVE